LELAYISGTQRDKLARRGKKRIGPIRISFLRVWFGLENQNYGGF